jgi:hypothetical protein
MAPSIYALLEKEALPGLLRAIDDEGRLSLAFMPYAWADSWEAKQFPRPGQPWLPSALTRALVFELRGALGPNQLLGLALHLPGQRERLDVRDVSTSWFHDGSLHEVQCSIQASAMLGLTTTPVRQALNQFRAFTQWLMAVHRQHAPTAPNAEGHLVAGPELAVRVQPDGPAQLTWQKGKGLTEAQWLRLHQELARWVEDPHIAGWVQTMKAGALRADPGHAMALKATQLFPRSALVPDAPVPRPATPLQRVGDHFRRRRQP